MQTALDAVLLTEAEAAKKLLAKAQTLRAWRHRGRGPAYLKLTGRIRYRVEDLEAFIAQSRVVPGEVKRSDKRRRGSSAARRGSR